MLDYSEFLTTADISQDGHIVGMSAHTERHPVYKTEAVDCKFSVRFTLEQAGLAYELLRRFPGDISFSIRSALAQLGIDAFHPDCTETEIDGTSFITHTLITHLDEGRSEPVFNALRHVAGQGKQPSFSRVSLLPDQAIVPQNELLESIAKQRLELSADVLILPDGKMCLPLEHIQYFFDDSLRTPEALERIIAGSARGAIKDARTSQPALPEQLHAREFLVTGANISTPDFHIVLENMTFIRGEVSSIVHSASFFLDAGRTVKGAGDRQLELWNADGGSVQTADIQAVARAYRPSRILPAFV